MKIRRFKKYNAVNEDVQPAQQPVQNQQNADNQPVAAQPAPQQSEENQKMMTFLGDFQNKIASGDVYWALAYNLPEEIQKAVPEFKQGNPGAEAGIKSWDAYKQNPSQQSFQTLVGELSKFGTQTDQTQQQQTQQSQTVQQQPVNTTQQPVQPQQTQAQPTVAQPVQPAPVQNAVNAQAQQESLMKSFGKRLHESLEREIHEERVHNAIVDNAVNGHPDGWIA